MLFVIIGIYILIGGVSAASNFGRSLFNSTIWAIPFLPFMVIYYLVKGDKKKRAEAIIICKSTFLLVVIYLSIVCTIKYFS